MKKHKSTAFSRLKTAPLRGFWYSDNQENVVERMTAGFEFQSPYGDFGTLTTKRHTVTPKL